MNWTNLTTMNSTRSLGLMNLNSIGLSSKTNLETTMMNSMIDCWNSKMMTAMTNCWKKIVSLTRNYSETTKMSYSIVMMTMRTRIGLSWSYCYSSSMMTMNSGKTSWNWKATNWNSNSGMRKNLRIENWTMKTS